MELPKKQQQIVDFIRGYLEERDISPSSVEIARHIGNKSGGSVRSQIRILKEKGVLTYEEGKARSIRIVGHNPETKARGLPIVGVISAGKPLESFEETSLFDFHGQYPEEDYFGVKVKGDSMIDCNIQDGSIVVVKKLSRAYNGEIVAAYLVDTSELVLKIYRRTKQKIHLIPANRSDDSYRRLELPAEKVLIQGVVKVVVTEMKPVNVHLL